MSCDSRTSQELVSVSCRNCRLTEATIRLLTRDYEVEVLPCWNPVKGNRYHKSCLEAVILLVHETFHHTDPGLS